MKTKISHPKTRFTRNGFALVIVLSVVSLITLFIVAFLLNASVERKASSAFEASERTRQLAETAVTLVQTQISEAATQGSNVAWVSQPGMVRTFDTSGDLVLAYKLYSSSSMIVEEADFDLATDLPPDDWASFPAEWVDLNSPSTVNGSKVFPIADPAALGTIDGVVGLGPSAEGGFDIQSAPGATTYQALPMPVRWLYMLEDGTLVAPEPGPSGAVLLAGESSTNPAVGRVAFWADDETSKVNINTAGEGIFWDTPRGYSPTEVLELAIKQPWNGEFNRYPGHPATVSLSSIFPVNGYDPYTLPLSTTNLTTMREFLSLTPAYAFGGSEGGNILIPPSLAAATDSINTNLMDRKAERLYSSVDELLFAQDRSDNPLITEDVLESRRFFLTAHSRAPETNLFNLPRVAIWPVQDLTDLDWLKKTNPFDRLIAFCSATAQTSGSDRPYFFQRTNAASNNDLLAIPRNLQLYEYLQALTSEPIPGVGGNFLAKYGYPGERDQILTQMFDYIRTASLYDKSLDLESDGVTAVTPLGLYNFGAKPGNGHGQAAASRGPNGTMGQGRFHTLKELLFVFIANADGALDGSGDPHRSNDVTDTPAVPKGDWTDIWVNPMLKEPYPGGVPTALASNEMRVQLMVLPELFSTMAGMINLNPNITIEIKGMDQFRLGGKNLQLASGEPVEPSWCHFSGDCQALGGGLWDSAYNYEAQFTGVGSNGRKTPGDEIPVVPTNSNYAFISAPVTVNKGTMSFTGGKITVNIYEGEGVDGTLMQTIEMDVPNGTFPVPTLANDSDPRYWSAFNHSDSALYANTGWKTPYNTEVGNHMDSWGRARQRYNGAGNAFPGHPIRPNGDVLRAMVPASAIASDYRLVTPVTDNDSSITTLYEKHPLWDDTTETDASIFYDTAAGRKILAGGSMALETIMNSAPYSGTDSVNVDATGDFDLGPGGFLKGPLCNKPDEGDMHRASNSNWAGITPDSATAPYFQSNRDEAAYAAYFSPNRIMPSPVMFGSLPTGVKEQIPWRTLLFRPLATAEAAHKGATAPHDRYLLDLFWMPVVDPYAISDRLSTSGKINMNYQILPFTYIDRSAPLRAALKAERVTMFDMSNAYNKSIYSGGPGSGFPSTTTQHRKFIDADETLKQFQERFDQSDESTNVFVSPSEICEQFLIPEGDTYSNKTATATTWNARRQSGDNVRERLYATLYQKLTTKSNTFTVHFRAQSLKRSPSDPAGQWTEGKGVVTGEYRGSTTIERFINPEADIPDYAAAANPFSLAPLDDFYKWRAISNKQFAP